MDNCGGRRRKEVEESGREVLMRREWFCRGSELDQLGRNSGTFFLYLLLEAGPDLQPFQPNSSVNASCPFPAAVFSRRIPGSTSLLLSISRANALLAGMASEQGHERGDASPHTGSLSPEPMPQRPQYGTRKASGPQVVSRDPAQAELTHEVSGESGARALGPRCADGDVVGMGRSARTALEEQATSLQAGLTALVERVESVRGEHDKLEGENRFLQS
ncbi:MAG: hypothetical protein M1829_002762 [Trizodia sp. TS-e1964]|nr:MAG: hypothetical protein M1829_002762 [Trizodia sp. TS-e1964]